MYQILKQKTFFIVQTEDFCSQLHPTEKLATTPEKDRKMRGPLGRPLCTRVFRTRSAHKTLSRRPRPKTVEEYIRPVEPRGVSHAPLRETTVKEAVAHSTLSPDRGLRLFAIRSPNAAQSSSFQWPVLQIQKLLQTSKRPVRCYGTTENCIKMSN